MRGPSSSALRHWSEMWERYNEVYQLNARVLSTGYLREDDQGATNFLLDDVKYRDRDFVLIDESHNFRYPDTQRYKVMQAFLATGRRCCFLTATPRNKSAWDVYYQIKLFHQDDKTDLPVTPPDLKEYFKLIEKGEKKLPDLLANILVRRTRNHILRWYGFDSETHQPVDPSRFKEYLDGRRRAYVMVAGRHQFFPKRELETIEYSIEDTYQGLYQELRGYLGKSRKSRACQDAAQDAADALTYARYGLWHYVVTEKQRQEPYASLHRAGGNLRGLIRVLMFKRFESSVLRLSGNGSPAGHGATAIPPSPGTRNCPGRGGRASNSLRTEPGRGTRPRGCPSQGFTEVSREGFPPGKPVSAHRAQTSVC